MSKKLPVNRKLGFYISSESGEATVVARERGSAVLDSAKEGISRVFRDVRKNSLEDDVVVHRLKSAG